MITERTLKKWRREALEMIRIENLPGKSKQIVVNAAGFGTGIKVEDLNERILRMTQELLDQHLLRSKS